MRQHPASPLYGFEQIQDCSTDEILLELLERLEETNCVRACNKDSLLALYNHIEFISGDNPTI